MLNIALPKGRLGEKVYGMFERAGFECPSIREENRKLMKKKGIVIYLSVRPETVVQRLDVHQTGRPLLKGHVDVSYIESMMAKRDPIYRAFADCVIATDHREIDDICRDIISFVQGKA